MITELAALAAIGGACLSWYQSYLTRCQLRALTMPCVVVEFEPDQHRPGLFNLVAANVGNSIAYDIEIRIDPPIEHADHLGRNPIASWRFPVLGPGSRITSLIGRRVEDLATDYQVRICAHRDTSGNPIPDLYYSLNLSSFEWTAVPLKSN